MCGMVDGRLLAVKSIMARFALVFTFVLTGISLVGPVSAQTSWECAPPTPAASPAAGATAVATPQAAAVAFPEGGGSLTVFAASSLTDPFNKIKTDLEQQNPGLSITYNFAGSQALVTQLSEGAEADVVALASPGQMKTANEAGVIEGQSSIFAKNRLTVVVPKDNPAGISSPADLAKDGVKVVLAGEDVPVGQYGRQSLCNMGRDVATYGDGFVDRVAGNVVSEEDNVKAILAKVQLGEADAGIAYVTDVTPDVASDVTAIPIPDAVNVIASYPVAAVKGGQPELAQPFISYLLGPEGQATLQSFGFVPSS
jgi:molybdate transport system substrate-binding protein